MRYCHNCHRMTAGKPLFCQRCGSSYDIKLCPRLHINPRAASVCSQCGSKELSSPQPKVPLLVRPAVFLLGFGPGFLLLILLCIWVVLFIRQLLRNPNGLLPLMLVALALGLALRGWMRIHSHGKHK